jgi:hypothetical protein
VALTELSADALPGDVNFTSATARELQELAFFDQPAPVAIAALLAARPAVPRHRALRIAAAVLAIAGLRRAKPPSPAQAQALPAHSPEGNAGPSNNPAAALRSFSPFLENENSTAKTRDTHAPPQPYPLMAANVGLVLVHPFLPQLFAACGLVEEGRLRDPERAAALLHWLATGREEAFDFELGFAKLLLGFEPHAPLAVAEGLVGPREREEGEALLAAVIAHWKALGRTSAEGLRVAFLQRRGALREADAGWRLQPEPEGFDVLLGHLPWGISLVRLPWMTRPLYTDWPTP